MDVKLTEIERDVINDIFTVAIATAKETRKDISETPTLSETDAVVGYADSLNDFAFIFNNNSFATFYYLITTEDKEEALDRVFPMRNEKDHYDQGYVSAMNDMKGFIDQVMKWQ